MKTTRRLLVLAFVLVLPMWVAATASGAPDCSPGGKHEDKPACANGEDPPPEENLNLNCADLGWANDAGDSTLSISAADGDDCEDIAAVANGTTFEFTFDVYPDGQVLTQTSILYIRNSVPGDGCSGEWTYRDDQGHVLISGYGNGISIREVADGYTATLVVEEVFAANGDCTTDGEVKWTDGDPAHWVVTLARGSGKPLRGDQSITMFWTVS